MNAEIAAAAPRPWNAPVPSAARSRRWALAGALAGALLAMLLPPAVSAVRERIRAGSPDTAEARTAQGWPTRGLPREWRWSPPGVQVDQMFRRSR